MRLYPPTVRMPTLQINITSVVKNVKLLSLNIRGKGDKGEWWGAWIELWYIIRIIFKYHILAPVQQQYKK